MFGALLVAIVAGSFILADFQFLQTPELLAERFITLLSTGWVLKTLAFAVMVGAVMTLIERSGGVEGLVYELSHRRSWVKSRRSALMMSYIAGIVIFIESSITSLVAGAIGKPFAARYGFSRAKLALVCDSTSAPICSIIAINGWGALLLGLIGAQITAGVIAGVPSEWLIQAILYNFYAYLALLVTFAAVWFEIDIGPMAHARKDTADTVEEVVVHGNVRLFLWPMVWMSGGVIGWMAYSGQGNILKGSGTDSIFYSLIVTLTLMFVYYRSKRVMQTGEFFSTVWIGIRSMVPIASILLLAFAIGGITSDLKAGEYLASFVGNYLNGAYIAAAIFIVSAVISFATGTSWGTFSIMMPIAIPLAAGVDAPMALSMAAVISGGVFGDHCSPISDTTIISSMASGCDVGEHVRTQLPYALIAAGGAMVLFIIFGVLLS